MSLVPRGLALAAATTGLAAVLAVPATPAVAATDRAALISTCDPLGALDGLVADAIAGLVPGADVEAVLDGSCIDTPSELGAVLDGASPEQLDQVLATLPPEQTGPGLLTLTPDDLIEICGDLSPERVRELAGDPTALDALLAGLSGVTDQLGPAPSPPAVDALLAQAEALLADGLPVDLTALPELDALLAELAGVVETPGVDPAGLQALYLTLAGALAGTPAADLPGGTSLLTAVGRALGVAPVGAPSGGQPAGNSPTPPPAGGTGPTAGPSNRPARNTAFRARLDRVKVARSRRTVKVGVVCPAGTGGCVVALTTRAAGRKVAKPTWVALLPGTRKAATIKLPSSAAGRLRRRGGKVAVKAITLGSSLAPHQRAAKVRRPRSAR